MTAVGARGSTGRCWNPTSASGAGASSFVLELSSADELFSDGKILPGEIRRDGVVTAHHSNCLSNTFIPSSSSIWDSDFSSAFTEKESLKEILSDSFDDDDDEGDDKPLPKPFWQFKCSSSLNCDVAESRGLIQSLQFLSRSNPTGSAPNPRDKFASKDTPRQNLQKQPLHQVKDGHRSHINPPSACHFRTARRNCRSPRRRRRRNGTDPACGSTPFLNFQPHIAIGTVSLFRSGLLSCNGKVRNKKK